MGFADQGAGGKAGQMTETRFWWVRHAPVVDNGGLVYGGTEVDADVKEARLFRGLSMTLPTNAVFVASALARTRQTLQAVRAAGRADIPAEPEQDPRLNEQHLGDWHGQPIAQMFPKGMPWPGFWMVEAEDLPPGGETFADVCRRVAEAIHDLKARHPGRNIVVAAHGGTIRAALRLALDVTPSAALAFSVDNCSITRIDHIEGGSLGEAWRIGGVNIPPD